MLIFNHFEYIIKNDNGAIKMDKYDLLFWTDILSEHAKFQINAFSHKEGNYISTAERFYHNFIKYNQTIEYGKNVDMYALENDVIKFISFKKEIIFNLLHHNILINFSPSFINHMVNEANEFLGMFRSGICPEKTQNPSLYIKIWLADASGHASTLSAFLDLAEVPNIQHAEFFKDMFDKLGKKASEITMIKENMETHVDVSFLKEETIEALDEFILYVEKIGELLDSKRIMSVGTMSSEITTHFVKEHRYFINKLNTCL